MKGNDQRVSEDRTQVKRCHDGVPKNHVACGRIQHKFRETVVPRRFDSLFFVALPFRFLVIVDSVMA